MGLLPDVPPAKVPRTNKTPGAGAPGLPDQGSARRTGTTPAAAQPQRETSTTCAGRPTRGTFGHRAMSGPATTSGLRLRTAYGLPARTAKSCGAPYGRAPAAARDRPPDPREQPDGPPPRRREPIVEIVERRCPASASARELRGHVPGDAGVDRDARPHCGAEGHLLQVAALGGG